MHPRTPLAALVTVVLLMVGCSAGGGVTSSSATGGRSGDSSRRAVPAVDLPPPVEKRVVAPTDEPTSVALRLLDDSSLPPETRIELLDKLTREHPGSAGVFEALAMACERAGRDDEAIAAFREALRLDPARSDSWLHLGVLLKRGGRDWGGAITALNQALETGAPRPRTLNELGVSHAMTGDLDRALGIWERAIEESPEWGVLYANALKGALQRGDEDLARSYYERGMQSLRPEANLALQWGEHLAESGRAAEAAAVYDEAAERFPESSRIAYYHAQALRQVGRLDEARTALLRAIDLDADGPKGRFALWSRRALFILEYPEEESIFQASIQAYFKAMEIRDPDERRRRLETTRPDVETLVRTNPEFWNAWSLLAWIDRRLGRFDEAEAHLERVLALFPEEPNAVHEQGLLLRERGRLEEARARLLDALALAPRDPAVLSNLTLTEIDLGLWQEAQARIQRVDALYGREAGDPLRDYATAKRSGQDPAPGRRPEVPIGRSVGER